MQGNRTCQEEVEDEDEDEDPVDELEEEDEEDEEAGEEASPRRLGIRAASPSATGASSASFSCPSWASSSASVNTMSGGGGKMFLSASRNAAGNGSNVLGCNCAWSRLCGNNGAWTHQVFILSEASSRVSPSMRFIRFVQSVTADILW